MPPGYPYNMDPAFGAVPMVGPSAAAPPEDGGKLSGQPMIKEERLKESPSPNDNAKSQPMVCIFIILDAFFSRFSFLNVK